MRGIRVFRGATIQAWGIVTCNFFGRPINQEDISKFEFELVKKA